MTGFLGSGKTTFVKRLLEEYAGNNRIAVVQNEFAPENVDGDILKASGADFQLLEVNRGSVFCICLLGGFAKSLSEFISEHRPEMIILEASGMADPIGIAELMQSPELNGKVYLASVFTIVDALNYERLKSNKAVINQVRVADTILLNKLDKPNYNIPAINTELKSLNPFADIVHTSYCIYDNEELNLEPVTNPAVTRMPGGTPAEKAPEDLEMKVYSSHRTFSVDSCLEYLKTLSADLVRLKGFLPLASGEAAAIQFSFGDFDIQIVNSYTGPAKLIALGKPGTPGEAIRNLVRIAGKG